MLNGPQGTLFGKNSSVGLISITTQRPTDEFSATIDGSLADNSTSRIRANVNVPLSENASARFVAFHREEGDYIQNLVTGDDVNGSDATGFKAKLLWEPSDTFSAYGILEYVEAFTTCCHVPMRNDARTPAPVFASITPLGLTPGPNNNQVAVAAPNVNTIDSNTFAATFEFTWDIGEHSLVAVTGYRDFEIDRFTELAFYPEDDPICCGTGGGNRLRQNIVFGTNKQFSQELRLVSPVGNTVDYVLGLYYYDLESLRVTDRIRIDRPGPLDTDPIRVRPAFIDNQIDNTSLAAFGQANIHVTDALNVFIGGRYTSEDVDFEFLRIDDPVAPFRGGDLAFTQQQDDNNFSIRAGLQYNFTDNVMGYFSYGQGYKGPSFQVTTTQNLARDLPLNPEESGSFEIGLKSTLADGKLQVNLAIFDTIIDDFSAPC